ncbi:hypothetical protein R5R35_005451 [Gryllus longicercus]|uniref:Methyltransferase domain-containing protein n=1 Tax=Gryllus longicercus TaxID=2509291 RepID=A0AAN9VVU2_9ORTH
MYQPALYARSNAAQRESVSRVLREWAGRLRWSREEQEAVLDVGCGPGDVTAQLLLPRLPSSVRVLVGHDVSEAMVRHAAAAHAALAPRLRFLCTDIAARDLPATPLGACAQQLQGFHKVFSFYALHWVADQRTALRNIHSLLRPGGEALLLLVANSPMYDAHIAMQNNPRWCNFMQDANCFMSPYKRSTDPVNDFSAELQKAGFNIHACQMELFSYRYPTTQEFGDSTIVLNPFLKRVPEELKTIFINDFMREYQREKVKYMSMVSSQELERIDTALIHSHLITHVEKHNQDVS